MIATIRDWLSFKGRLPLGPYWRRYLLPLLALHILAFVADGLLFGWASVLPGPSIPSAEAATYSIRIATKAGKVGQVVFWLSWWPGLAGMAKRWHDRGRSGWWSLLLLVPLLGWLWIFISLCCRDGVRGPNRYGPDPLSP
ncbi:DUF805 domain-containing protein [Roseomonas sp. GC11]|uniref:DUF805 domain-containing protein n=1 Tax=Roseomonas sp. GC11 TaxID=2950546 RepID=UPI0021093D75|nr:DUF805 domain-containing protein [Roseomonas sp. GC11]MCQ4160882.1 DUF805 domain-containing protein [Roseomonas sp. GC11]